MAVLGYARVSTKEQKTWNQVARLEDAGAERVFVDDGVSGAISPWKRPALRELLDYARDGDEIVVYRLDRLGRRAVELLTLIEELTGRGVTVRLLNEGLVTGGTTGKIFVMVLAILAELERDTIRERTIEAIEMRRERGLPVGRPKALTDDQEKLVAQLRAEGRSCTAIAAMLNVSKSTVGRIPPASLADEELRDAERVQTVQEGAFR